MSNIITATESLTMTSREIAELVNSRHDNVKRTIDRLITQGVISSPPLEYFKNINNVEGQEYVFTSEQGKRDSIVVVAQLSPEFTARLVDRWQELESQQAKSLPSVKQSQTGLPEFRRARAIDMATKAAERIAAQFPSLSEDSRRVIFANVVNPVAGTEVISLPRIEHRYYTAGEVGEKLGVSANMVGRIANTHELKTAEHGQFRLDKSKHSSKQVESFVYNDKGVEAIAAMLRRPQLEPEVRVAKQEASL